MKFTESDLKLAVKQLGKPLGLAVQLITLMRENKIDTKQIRHLNKFIFYLKAERMAKGHRGIKDINENSHEYKQLVEIVSNADKFCTDFNISKEQGYKYYIRRGLEIMGRKYGINKFKYYHDRICTDYFVEQLRGTDVEKLASKIKAYYYEKIGLDAWDLFDDDFLLCAELVWRGGWDYRAFIDAQFRSNFIPEPNQLHTRNAEKRFAKEQLKSSKKSKLNDEYLNLLKNGD